eukprot:197037_1
MIYLLLTYCISYGTYGGFIHTKQGVMSNVTIEFDTTNPLASHPDLMSYIQHVYERNVRRGLDNPATLSTVDKQIILDLHNKIRSETARGLYEGPGGFRQPQSCDMNALSWSETLEHLATEWSAQCYFEHSSNRQERLNTAVNDGVHIEWNKNPSDECGENIYISGAPPALNAVYSGGKNFGILGGIEDGWSKDESLLYKYQNRFYEPAAHYTAVVWSNTRYVGCGFSQCSGATSNDQQYPWAQLLFTCNYYPQGNYDYMFPYKSGEPCSCCNGDRHACTHDGGLCGGGWSSNWNNYQAADILTVDRCYDGLGRNVCTDADNNDTPRPTSSPSPQPSVMPSHVPSEAPSITQMANPTASPGSGGATETVYAIRVSTDIIWLSYQNDYDTVQQTVEELMFAALAEPYLDLQSAYIDQEASSTRGPYCARPSCRYSYGFIKVPLVLEGATLKQKEDIVSNVNDGIYAEDLCGALTAHYEDANGKGLRCYRVTASVESITESQYQQFIGVIENEEGTFDGLNLTTYSSMDIIVLLVCLGAICCCCWCVGWYTHKKRYHNELESALNEAQMYNPRMHQSKLRRQLSANQESGLFTSSLSK